MMVMLKKSDMIRSVHMNTVHKKILFKFLTFSFLFVSNC